MVLTRAAAEDLRGQCALADGTFDPLHHGHIAYLRAARAWLNYHHFYGLPLVCNIAPDAYLVSKHLPVVPEDGRAALVDGLDDVTHTIVGDTLDTLQLLQPTHFIKGSRWEGQMPQAIYQTCRDLGISIKHVVTGFDDLSSSAMLARYHRACDRRAVKALETFIQAQPAQKPWRPVIGYTLEDRRRDEGPLPGLIKDVFEPKSVLDYGCGAGHLVTLLREVGVAAWGWDPSGQETVGLRAADVVVCREVFEHVPLIEWADTVSGLVSFAERFIYVTTRFHPRPTHLLDVTVDGGREIDPTEITFATKDLLRTLFVLHGCRIRPDLEARLDWKGDGNCLVFEV